MNALTGDVQPRMDIDVLLTTRPDTFNLFLLAMQKFQEDKDLLGYFSIAGIHGLPSTPWDGVVKRFKDVNGGYCAHGVPIFPTWHRPYLALLEQTVHKKMVELAGDFQPPHRQKYLDAAKGFRFPYLDYFRPRDFKVTVPNLAKPSPFNFRLPDIFNEPKITLCVAPLNEIKYDVDNPLYAHRFSEAHGQFSAGDQRLIASKVRKLTAASWLYPLAPVSGDKKSSMTPRIDFSPATWSDAVKASRELLSKAERDRFGRSGPHDIITDFEGSQTAAGKSSRVQNILRKIQPLVSAIERFGKPLDVVVNASPEILSPAWGILRAVLIIARDYELYFSKLLDMLRDVSDAIPGFYVYEQLFHKHAGLREALVAMYCDIITFLVKAKKVFSSGSFRLFGRVTWKPFEQTFQSSLASLKRHGDLVQREAKLAHLVEEAQARLDLAHVKVQVEEQVNKQAPALPQVKFWLQARQCEGERDDVRIVPGTCQWVLERPELSTWLEQETTQLLWLYGAPGCGKSYIYTKLLDYISKRSPLAFFYFCGADNGRVTTSALIRSWTYQLAKMFPQAMACLQSVMQTSENREASNNEVRNLFLSILELSPSCILTVDAVDECPDRVELFRLLNQIPTRFKVFIASRRLLDLSNQLRTQRSGHTCLEVTAAMTGQDIELYVEHSLSSGTQVYEPKLSRHIQEKLAHPGGMFLWVRLMLEHIEQQTSDAEILDCLEQLPQSLSERYDRILETINRLPPSQRLLAHKVFFWLNTARRPLRVKEVCALLAVRPSEGTATGYEATRRVRDPEQTIVAVCGSLVTARGADRVLYPIHFTVTEYLRDYISKSRTVQDVASFYQFEQLKSSSGIAAAVCLRYLSLDAIAEHFRGTGNLPSSHEDIMALQFTETPILDALLYAGNSWFLHLQEADDPEQAILANGIVRDVLNTARENMEISWRIYWFSGSDTTESAICPSKFSPIHIASYLGLEAVVQHLLSSCDPTLVDSMGRNALWWAVSRRHAETSRVLVQAGVVPKQPDACSVTPLHRAAAIGDVECFEALLAADTRSVDPIQDAEGWTVLHFAAARGHEPIVRSILNSSFSSVCYGTRRSRNGQGRTPLHLAALNGHAHLIHDLAFAHLAATRTSEWLNAQDVKGQTALHLAATAGHLKATETLVMCAADPTILDNSGKTPAHRALQMGNETIAALLADLSTSCAVKGWTEKRLVHAAAKLDEAELEPYTDEFIDAIVSSNLSSEVNSRDAQDSSLAHTAINGHHLGLTVLVRKKRKWSVTDERGRSLLHITAALGETSCAREVIKLMDASDEAASQFLDQQDDRGWTALHYAAGGMFDGIARLLLESGASADLKNHDGLTPFDLALQDNHGDTVEVLLRFGGIPVTYLVQENLGWSDLHRQAHDGTLSSDAADAANVALLTSRDRFGKTAIYRALAMGHAAIARMLDRVDFDVGDCISLATITADACPDDLEMLHRLMDRLPPFSLQNAAEESRGLAQQLLVTAAQRNDVRAIQLLSRAGVSLDVRDASSTSNRRSTALQLAIEKGHMDAAICLVDSGAQVNLPDAYGHFPIHTACESVGSDIVEYLLHRGADPNQYTLFYGESREPTPLKMTVEHFISRATTAATLESTLTIIRTLLDYGARPDAVSNTTGPSNWEYSPIVTALSYLNRRNIDELIRSRCKIIVDLFSARGFSALLRLPNKDGLAPIHQAARVGDVEAVRRELQDGVPVDWQTFGYPRKRPLEIAVEGNNRELVALLLEYGADVQGYVEKDGAEGM
ncbi:hypothetical protein OQA88_5945 [Cercophora sp. LCS_1]